MCGIIGYIGSQSAAPILLEGLKRLEYRGYDSAGVATLEPDQTLHVYKSVGKVMQLDQSMQHAVLRGKVGIGHTRWATHGGPTVRNAHPHRSAAGKLALVHNGIIENYQVLKNALLEKGVLFESDTDTEVLVKLTEHLQQEEACDTLSALRKALLQVNGTYAIALLDERLPGQLFVARKGSPLVIGKRNDSCYIASDATVLTGWSDQLFYLDEEEIAVIGKQAAVRFLRLDGTAVMHSAELSKATDAPMDKADFPHYMLKEIFEQPAAIRRSLAASAHGDRSFLLDEMTQHPLPFQQCQRIIIVACGTSWHASLIGKQYIEQYCRIPVTVEYASEFRYNLPVISARDLLIAVSQSGETADTLAAMSLARSQGAFVYGFCNVAGSSVARQSDLVSLLHVGPEIGVASTKAFTGQVLLFLKFALSLSVCRNALSTENQISLQEALRQFPSQMERVLQQNEWICQLSKRLLFVRNMLYLGRGLLYPLALEGALKLKEISYIHAEGYPAAEMKHGPIALIDAEMPVVFLALRNALYEKAISNLQEVKARQAFVLAIATEGDEQVAQLADEVIYIPAVDASLEPLLAALPLQLLAYHIAVAKHCDVDQPRNLAKSVTVE